MKTPSAARATSRLLLTCALLGITYTATLAAQSNDAEINRKVEDLLRQMTVEEKVGQLSQLGGMPFIPDSIKIDERVRRGHAGSILWLSDPKAINRLQHIAVEQSRLHIPAIFGLDVIHGFKTIFPIPLAMAASWDPALVERSQTVAAREARASGIHWTFAPMVDIARDARWGRIIEGAGEDPYLGAAIARAQVRGFQGTDLGKPERVLACAKHFAGYGAAEGGRDYESVYISEDQMWNVYLPPFQAAAEAGAVTFMSAYMDLNNVPATANRFLLQDVLRTAWGFQGFVVSDANAVGDLVTHGFATDKQDAGFRALTAGVNMDMASHTYLDHIPALVAAGRIPMSLIDELVRPVLAAKFKLKLFEHPYVDESRTEAVFNAPEHRQAARVAAQRSAVLLRNESAALPLTKDASKSVAVIGPLGDSLNDMLGSWTTFGLQSDAVTILQGIKYKLGSASKVEFAPGVQIRKQFVSMFDTMLGPKPTPPWTEDQSAAEFAKAVELAKRSDVIVLALGQAATMSGELASQASLELPGRQQQLMEAIVALGKPVVLVLVTGRPVNITWAAAHVPAILEVWHAGTEAGNAIADLLFGDAVPGGKLPVTWPLSVGQEPLYYAHNLSHDPKNQDQRYWDEASKPLYPFGYGLSYTSFSFTNPRVSRKELKAGQSLEVSVDVENTGSRAGDEVAQLYIHQQTGSASRPVRELKGFERLTLAPHEKRTVRFQLGERELRYWNSAAKGWVVEPAKFDVWVGGSSDAPLHAGFTVTR